MRTRKTILRDIRTETDAEGRTSAFVDFDDFARAPREVTLEVLRIMLPPLTVTSGGRDTVVFSGKTREQHGTDTERKKQKPL